MARKIRYKTERPVAFFDLETYWNYFYVGFRTIDGRKIGYERSDRADFDPQRVRRILKKYTIVGFNSRDYDLMVLLYAISGASNADLKKLNDYIIKGRKKPWDCERDFGIVIPDYVDHVDLFDTNPSVGSKTAEDDEDEAQNIFASGSASLKTLIGRLHGKRLQDLPVDPDNHLTHDEMDKLSDYCLNSDVPGTILLWEACKELVELRESMGELYGADFRSFSDAQAGERMIKIGVERLLKSTVQKTKFDGKPYTFRYEVPDFIKFKTPQLQNILKVIRETDIHVTEKGSVKFPDAFKNFKIVIGGSSYKLGIGGLHSQEKNRAVFSDDDGVLTDWDVGSQYPSAILKLGLFPKALGKLFLKVYGGIKSDRMVEKNLSNEARDSGDRNKELYHKQRSDGLKTGLNGPYGKLGSVFSILFAPHLMIATTLTCQLTLLMFIESAELMGISVKSANTDGVVLKVPKNLYSGITKDRPNAGPLADLIQWWEDTTSFILEGAEYKAIYNQHVNCYLAVKDNGKAKRKGFIANHWHPDSPDYNIREQMKKNPKMTVCGDAILAYLTKGTPIEEFIRSYTDVRGFVTVIKAKGGGDWNGEYLGKTVRFYWAKDGAPIMRGKPHAKTGNRAKVSKSDGSRPLMTLPDDMLVPADVDYDRYIAETYEILSTMGCGKSDQTALDLYLSSFEKSTNR